MEPVFSTQIIEKYSVSNFMSCSTQMDRQTDMMKPIVAFYNFVNVPKKI
jgi:hypothetical protein